MCSGRTSPHITSRLALSGWAHPRLDPCGLVFVHLRDERGRCRLGVEAERAPEAIRVAHEVRNEFVLRAEGEVVARAPEAVNPNLPTGEVELQVDALEIISRCPPLPFQLDEEGVDETLRLRYRWLDLRRDSLQRNIRLRAKAVSIIRREMEAEGFVDIETPIMAKPTPEGARDFLVPTRLQELTQLDVEMAFPDLEYLFALTERTFTRIWDECIGVRLEPPFPRMTWDEAQVRYGSDKPDLRFGLEIEDASEATRESKFRVFAEAPAVRFIRVPQGFSRAELERLEDFAKEWGAKGLAYLVFDEV